MSDDNAELLEEINETVEEAVAEAVETVIEERRELAPDINERLDAIESSLAALASRIEGAQVPLPAQGGTMADNVLDTAVQFVEAPITTAEAVISPPAKTRRVSLW